MNKNLNNDASSLISVLVPMYNTQKTIARCIKSILKQTYSNLEIVLLDDGSTDNTYEIAKTFAQLDSRIKLLSKQNEKNISKTRNFLLNNFSGEYFVWVDSDDVVHKRYVEKLYKTITSTNSDLGICGYKLKFLNTPLPKKFFQIIKLVLCCGIKFTKKNWLKMLGLMKPCDMVKISLLFLVTLKNAKKLQ